ncbi:MAG TPA: hypothetical protein VJT50_03695 [Pyrinomonadaceae bacterium]|nr:hypothetical protein [Pyrinomonadaceae bacterium]
MFQHVHLPTFDHVYNEFKSNQWLRYFAVFCRVALALGFIPSGIVKIMGQRFTGLPSNHPLGHYFDALYLTGFYYRFIGVGQLTVALLLLIPRTALLGAILYFPIILNICVLAYSTRFEGTRITTLMVLANLYLLCWDYARLKYVLPFTLSSGVGTTRNQKMSRKFPVLFFGGVVAVVAAVIIINAFMYEVRPGNSELECTNGCRSNARTEDCLRFCNCIYNEGNPLDKCLMEYHKKK